MKIALIGYGKMGQAIEQVALQSKHTIIAAFKQETWDSEKLKEAEICIEFTQPNAVLDNIKKLAALKKNIVVGTTGWYEHLPEVDEIVRKHEIALLYAPNFALGVNIYYELVCQAAKLFHYFPNYDVAGIEYHHKEKKDSPSGFAGKISEIVKDNMSNLNEVSFSSVRCGHIVGIHSLLFDSAFDSITLTHESKNRQGFAAGALQAAEWLLDKKGLYTFTDCIKNIFERVNL